MFKVNYAIVKLLVLLGFSVVSMMARAVYPVTIENETSQFILDIKYPQGFRSVEMNSDIKKEIEALLSGFKKELAEDKETPADAPGKSSLTMNYSVPFQTDHVVSLRFNISTYHRGAAHPSNRVMVMNFIDGKRVQLSDLFVSGSDYLKPISEFCYKYFIVKQFSDQNWIIEGTKPIIENYNTWFFTKTGISILFNNYQVAAYVYGEQRVEIPLSLVKSMIKLEFLNMIWEGQ